MCDFKAALMKQQALVKEGYLLLSKGLLTKQNRVQESEEKISIRKDIPTKMDKDKDKDNIVLANTPEYVAAEIKKLKNSPKDTATMMYLNIGGTTKRYRVEHAPGATNTPGFKIYEGENGTIATPIYGSDLEKAANLAVKSQTKAEAMSQALYEQNK
jgi:hypothetical protein